MSRVQAWLRRWWVAKSIPKRAVALSVKTVVTFCLVTLLSILWAFPLWLVVGYDLLPWFGEQNAAGVYGTLWLLLATRAFCFTTDPRERESVIENPDDE
jgi:hypothetical protein